MLIIVHDGNFQLFLQPAFDLKTFGSFDVFKIDSAKRRRNSFYCFDKIIYVGLIDLDIKNINVSKNFKEQSLAFHHRLRRFRANVA